MSQNLSLFATCPKGVEDLLASECRQQGLTDISSVHGGVACRGDIEQAYRLCLWSRVASRVLMQLHRFAVTDHEQLYRQVQAIDWSHHLDDDGSFAIDVKTGHKTINNSRFAALKIKDAIADQFRSNFNRRPDVKLQRPDIRINAYINKKECSLYLDLSGEPLHRRGYRQQAGAAPLKENLAAAILLRAHWPEIAEQGRPLIDPLCGSGTLLLEAAYIAADMAPGLLRSYFGFIGWKRHEPAVWKRLHDAAADSVDKERLPRLVGIEKSFKVAGIARSNIKAAGFEGMIEIRQADSVKVISDMKEPGLIVANPPYGKRIGEIKELKQLYLDLGKNLKNAFPGWDVALFTASHELAKFFGLRAHHKNTLYNGPLKCTLYQYHIRAGKTAGTPSVTAQQGKESDSNAEAAMFRNRLSKNMKHLSRWARKENISCYRVYDADIPQFAIAVDIYQDWVHVQEYKPPKTVDTVKAFVRLNEAVDIIAAVLQVDKHRIVLKTRKRQSGAEQYTRQGDTEESLVVNENDLKFRVNLKDYIDTGLFLDHRLTRRLISKLSTGKSFLNLFAYTGTATVYAVAGGAAASTTVDMSNTYLRWAQDNLKLNHLAGRQHVFIRDDVLQWLQQADAEGRCYQLIFLDPPTFSNSKRMDRTLDIRRDHVELIRQTMALLAEDGVLLFSCNAQGFKLDQEQLQAYPMRDLTGLTTTEDFRRKPGHVCWCLAKKTDVLKNCSL
ncbi:MAG: bifunctional 23S rRNA (guanine(2069)-N(7))-methyltransferase RlmK/23S rRNA (guanine(2445)-N(2))-methyltransferase RlmL [Thiotrichales bacterium]|nr:MAG: bifunctional 23S rRNA (guanine(2069)-N(7))-methyltransferase RlmK/23S rRNA (guanine(2445)-N(2))-methyltransferase RlmL [Thiotrichales bacterium]